MDSTGYGMLSKSDWTILAAGVPDQVMAALLNSVRARILSESERLGLNQVALAARAGINQSNLSKLEDLDRPMTEIRARVLFAIITKGLGVPLSQFFADLEANRPGTTSAPAVDVDQGLPALPSDAQLLDAILYRAGQLFAKRESASEHEADRGHAPNPRIEEAQHGPPPRKVHRRTPRRTKTRRPGK